MQDQEGGVTHFPSGIAGVAVVLFALMGTIGVGYLLNGTTATETVNDYEYVTDVSGLYSYTPVTAYTEYSPVQNNYQYNTDASLLGTYTSGIDYTQASAANLCPIITPATGYQEVTRTFSYADLQSISYSQPTSFGALILGQREEDSGLAAYQGAYLDAYFISAADLVTAVGAHTNGISITIPTNTLTYSSSNGGTIQVQNFTVLYKDYPGEPDYAYAAAEASGGNAGAVYGDGLACVAPIALPNAPYTYNPASTMSSSYYFRTIAGQYYTERNLSGSISNLVLNDNGTTTYTFSYDGGSTSVNASTSDVYFMVWSIRDPSWTGQDMSIDYTTTVYTNTYYMDPSAGVSVSGDSVYWSNSNNIGELSMMFARPASAGSCTVQPWTGTTDTWGVAYDSSNGWTFTVWDTADTQNTYRIGDWPAVQVTTFYTGEVQVTPVSQFVNFTSYVLRSGSVTTYDTRYTGDDPITTVLIGETGTRIKFAVVETTTESGTVPGAMYNGTLDTSIYFPDYTTVRLSFDSAAYVGSSVTVGSWTMAVDSASFQGTFSDSGTVYTVDLTQPWAIVWSPSGVVQLVFTEVNQLGTQTVTILDSLTTPSVTLSGLWAVDTDLYNVTTHQEEVYNWNFGDWGLTKVQFLVCVMGLTALISIAMKLGGVPFRALDFVVILFANVICWVIM